MLRTEDLAERYGSRQVKHPGMNWGILRESEAEERGARTVEMQEVTPVNG